MSKKHEPLVKSRSCKFCKHEYVTPCDGENETCQNAIWLKSGKDLAKYKSMLEKIVPSTVKQQPAKKGRTRL